MSPSVSPLIESDMTAMRMWAVVYRSRNLSQGTAGVVLNPHPAEAHWPREGV